MPEAPDGVPTPDETLVQRSRRGDGVAREELFRRHFGVAYRVAYRHLGHHEDALDAVTAMSGSGPAYVFYFIEAMTEAGVELGLSPTQAHRLAVGTFGGATALAAGAVEPPAVLRALAAHVPDARVVIMPDTTHFMFGQDPGGYCAAVMDFLAPP